MELIAKGWNALHETDRVIDYTYKPHPLCRVRGKRKKNFSFLLYIKFGFLLGFIGVIYYHCFLNLYVSDCKGKFWICLPEWIIHTPTQVPRTWKAMQVTLMVFFFSLPHIIGGKHDQVNEIWISASGSFLITHFHSGAPLLAEAGDMGDAQYELGHRLKLGSSVALIQWLYSNFWFIFIDCHPHAALQPKFAALVWIREKAT